jgi:NAD-dependent dihydropyrimidine dehydrogenase PreA subunit
MTFIVTQPCLAEKNRSCAEVCPVDCIYDESDELDRMVFINADECIDCGACEAACPVNAIFQDTEVPEEWQEYVDLNQQWFEDKDSVRARLLELESA